MKIPISTEQHITIIGAGIAGLAAAWYLQQAGIEYTLLEASARFGGLIHTIHENDYTIEFGPDTFITRKPWAMTLVKELGIEDEVIAINDTPERIYVLSNGKLTPLPDGLGLLVPTNIPAFLDSPLLSWGGKIRALMDYVIPAREGDDDESLADFVIRRMGEEVLDKLADPLLAGVYNAEMDKQSILATFPQYRALEKKHGSLIRGMMETQEKAPPSSEPALVSFKQGMGQLIDTLVEKLTGNLRLNTEVESIESGYKLQLSDGKMLETDGIIVATPANSASQLLADIAPDAAKGLAQIRYAGIGSMSLAFSKSDVRHPLDAYGVVIPSSAGRNIDGMQWNSSKWPHRAPEDKALIRVFFGGPHTRTMLNKNEYELLAIVREELRAILGITAKPEFYSLGKWENAYPQYDVGHIERVNAIEEALPEGIAIAGNAYHGVGIPDTVKTAKAAAQKLTENNNIVM
jgi:oxygen-dependent protoporphyrinogen oxidase